MTKRIFFIIVYLTFFFNVYAQDSLKNSSRFLFGFSGAPNNTSDVSFFFAIGDKSSRKNEKISFGGEGKIFLGIQKRNIQTTLGFGFAYHQRLRHSISYGDVNEKNDRSSNFHYKFYTTSLNVNWLVGNKNNWIIGTNIECAILYSFKQVINEEVFYSNGTSIKIDLTYKYLTPQNIFWTGVNFGRKFKINELIDFSFIFNTKISTPILGNPSVNSNVKTSDRILVVKTINFSFSFKL